MGYAPAREGAGVLTYYPVPAWARQLCGLGYGMDVADQPVTLRLTALMPQLQIVLSGGLTYVFDDMPTVRCDPATLVGPTHAASLVTIAPHSRIIGIGLRPAGWAGAVGVDAAELGDTAIPAAAVWGDARIRDLFDQLSIASDTAMAAAMLFRFVSSRADRAIDGRDAVIERWLASPSRSVDALVTALDLSNRQAERLTRTLYGAPPKRLAMKYRSLRLATALSVGEAPSLTANSTADFYDQSHLIHNFRRFIGYTPRQFMSGPQLLTREMIAMRWQAGARGPVNLWS